MGKLIRFINQGIKHFFIIDGEYFGDGSNQFENRLPDSFTDSQLVAVLSHLPEEFTYGLVVHETFHGREYVVLECHDGRACNLRSEVGRLAHVNQLSASTYRKRILCLMALQIISMVRSILLMEYSSIRLCMAHQQTCELYNLLAFCNVFI